MTAGAATVASAQVTGGERRVWRIRLRVLALLLLALTVGGCGGGAQTGTAGPSVTGALSAASGTVTSSGTGAASSASAAATSAAVRARRRSIDGCLFASRGTRLIDFRAPGERLRGAIVGAGHINVVLANQTDNSVCQWLPFPSYLAARGMRVLAFDYGNGDESTEVQAAARYLRAQGAGRLVLIGASLGGAVVIDAALHLSPRPEAVVSLSAVPEVTPYPFPADARRLRAPIFQIGATEDPVTQYAKDTRMLFRASSSPAKRLLLLPGSAHGTDFVGQGGSARVRAAIVAFVRAHT